MGNITCPKNICKHKIQAIIICRILSKTRNINIWGSTINIVCITTPKITQKSENNPTIDDAFDYYMKSYKMKQQNL